MTIRISSRVIAFVILGALAAISIALVLHATPEGLGLTDDSIAYIAGARSMLAGQGYREAWLASNGPVTHFPPAYPSVLAFLGLFGLDPLRGSRFLNAVLFGLNTALMGISQTRAKIGGGGPGYGPQTEAQGGNAWKYFADLRISLRRVEQEKAKTMNHLTHKVEERITGGKFEGKVEKSKVSKSQGRKENFYITWGLGIDDLRSLVEIAVSHNIVKKSGG